MGSTDAELADFFEVHVDSIYEWKKVYPKFSDAIKKGKLDADANVAQSLYKRALGYSHPDVDIRVINDVIETTKLTKHYPPDTTAAIFWLKNRQNANWRDRQEVTGKDGAPLTTPGTAVILTREQVKDISKALEEDC